jgi:hypothetical protein
MSIGTIVGLDNLNDYYDPTLKLNTGTGSCFANEDVKYIVETIKSAIE